MAYLRLLKRSYKTIGESTKRYLRGKKTFTGYGEHMAGGIGALIPILNYIDKQKLSDKEAVELLDREEAKLPKVKHKEYKTDYQYWAVCESYRVGKKVHSRVLYTFKRVTTKPTNKSITKYIDEERIQAEISSLLLKFAKTSLDRRVEREMIQACKRSFDKMYHAFNKLSILQPDDISGVKEMIDDIINKSHRLIDIKTFKKAKQEEIEELQTKLDKTYQSYFKIVGQALSNTPQEEIRKRAIKRLKQ